jgi:hypothetical protein
VHDDADEQKAAKGSSAQTEGASGDKGDGDKAAPAKKAASSPKARQG